MMPIARASSHSLIYFLTEETADIFNKVFLETGVLKDVKHLVDIEVGHSL